MSASLIGLVAHPGKPGAVATAVRLREDFRKHAVEVRMDAATARLVGCADGAPIAELAEACELLVVLGGDGTILEVVHEMGPHMKPVFGINLGSLGFLTCVPSSAAGQAVESIVTRQYSLSRRTMLEVEVRRAGETRECRAGLNDAVISRGSSARLIRLHTSIDNAALTEYNADGLIICTPTGSTAYSLAAGGPILTPESGVFAVTPICPHVLTNRSLIFGDQSSIAVTPREGQGEIYVTVDAQEPIRLLEGESVHIRKAPQCVSLAVLPGVSFFEVLRQKLKWSGTAI